MTHIQNNIRLFVGLILCIVMAQTAAAQTCNPTPIVGTGVTVASGISGICLFCSISGESNVIDANTTNIGNIYMTAGVAASGAVEVRAPSTYAAGTEAGFLCNSSGIGVLTGVTVSTYLDGTLQESASGSGLLVLGLTGSTSTVGFVTTKSFNRIRITVSSLVGLLQNIDIYYAYARRACFNFGDCSTAVVSGTFVVGTPSSGSITIPISNTKGGLATFSIGAGGYNTTLTTGQTSVTIPVSYDGTGTPGTYNFGITSSDGTGTCSVPITFYSPVCVATPPTLSGTTATNTCPTTTANLTNLPTSSPPSGGTITWHTGTPATTANKVATPAAVGTAGTYYAAYFDATNNCYSGTSTAVTVTLTNPCPPTASVTFTNPMTLGSNGTMTLLLTNVAGNPAQSGLGFTYTLPTGFYFTQSGVPTTLCGGAVTISGRTLTFTGGSMSSGTATCQITALIYATVPGFVNPTTGSVSGLTKVISDTNNGAGVNTGLITVNALPTCTGATTFGF